MANEKITNMFHPVASVRSYDDIYNHIENMIISGELKNGDKLPSERELMNMFHRSHPTIREALRMLESAGYIKIIPGSGSIIHYSGEDNARTAVVDLLHFQNITWSEIVEFYKLTEPSFAEKAAQLATWEDISAMAESFGMMKNSLNSPHDYIRAMLELHKNIIIAAHNPLLFIIWSAIYEYTEKISYRFSVAIPDSGLLNSIHQSIIDAIRAKDAALSEMLMRKAWDEQIIIHEDAQKRQAAPVQSTNSRKIPVAIYEQIKERILSGELAAGDQLPSERELIEIFQRSRPTIREALRMLESNKYVTISRGKGIIVNKLSTSEIEYTLNNMLKLSLITINDIKLARKVCEYVSVILACERYTEEDLETMMHFLKNGANLEGVALFECNGKLHLAIAEASHNKLLLLVSQICSELNYENYEEARVRLQKKYSSEPDIVIASKQQHKALFEAIKARDQERAGQIYLDHLDYTYITN